MRRSSHRFSRRDVRRGVKILGFGLGKFGSAGGRPAIPGPTDQHRDGECGDADRQRGSRLFVKGGFTTPYRSSRLTKAERMVLVTVAITVTVTEILRRRDHLR